MNRLNQKNKREGREREGRGGEGGRGGGRERRRMGWREREKNCLQGVWDSGAIGQKSGRAVAF